MTLEQKKDTGGETGEIWTICSLVNWLVSMLISWFVVYNCTLILWNADFRRKGIKDIRELCTIFVTFKITVMHHLTTAIPSEKCVLRRFCPANIVECMWSRLLLLGYKSRCHVTAQNIPIFNQAQEKMMQLGDSVNSRCLRHDMLFYSKLYK